jgi:hypothetical protein
MSSRTARRRNREKKVSRIKLQAGKQRCEQEKKEQAE